MSRYLFWGGGSGEGAGRGGGEIVIRQPTHGWLQASIIPFLCHMCPPRKKGLLFLVFSIAYQDLGSWDKNTERKDERMKKCHVMWMYMYMYMIAVGTHLQPHRQTHDDVKGRVGKGKGKGKGTERDRARVCGKNRMGVLYPGSWVLGFESVWVWLFF